MNETLIRRNLQKYISLNRFYSPGMGNFNITILNHYLTAGEITKELIEGILLTAAYEDAVILTTATDPETLQGHAVTLKRSNNNHFPNANTWFLLDSHSDDPKELLTSNDWNNLQGSIISFQQGSVWDGLHPESDLHLADSSFPLTQTLLFMKMSSILIHPQSLHTRLSYTAMQRKLATHCQINLPTALTLL
eukprot:1136642-Pelagomonas_calceolata.AAC.1